MKILVTGGNGYVGSNYIQTLVVQGVNIDNITIYDFPSNILDEYLLESQIKEHDIIVHFAAIADLYDSANNPDLNFEVNVRGTYNIAKFCNKYNKFLIYISTCCVYGNADDYELGYVDEKSYPMTNELYASTKLAGENIIRGFTDLNWSIWRIGTNFGINMRPSLFTYIALDCVKNNKTIKIHGDGQQTRNLIYIDDLCHGMYLITEEIMTNYLTSKSNKQIFNICGEEKISVLNCIKIAEKIFNKKADYIFVEDRQGQILKENIGIYKIKKYFGYKPKYCFYDAMFYIRHYDTRFK